jgi:urease accessory protein UreE
MAISNNDFQKAVKLHHLRVIAALSDLKLLARLGAILAKTEAPFNPEGGAYGFGRTHGHTH